MSIPVLDPIQDPEAERLIEDSRARAGTSLEQRELAVEALVALAFALVAVAMPLVLPADGDVALGTSALLIVLYAVARQVGFEIGTGYTCPFLLVLVPMLFLVPAPLVPAHVAAGLMLGALVTRSRARRLGARAVLALGQSWHSVAPALVLSAVGLGVPLRATLRPSLWVYGDHPGAVLLELPLMGLLWLFARERSWRIDQALELSSAYRGTALLLGDVVEFDHEYTGSHSRDVVELSVAVGARLRLSAAQLRNLEFAALLHDVGKIAVPKEIINKPGLLDHEEWEIMRRHTIEGQRMLDSVGGVLANVGVIVRASHEQFDGTGYPDGLAGGAIPIEARICSVCDAFSAMTTDRPYREAMPAPLALAELRRCAGTQFDPAVVAAFERVIERTA
jgi:HD-GYP domain-containing protein (c-di-GMP phosphodiesterase class II)